MFYPHAGDYWLLVQPAVAAQVVELLLGSIIAAASHRASKFECALLPSFLGLLNMYLALGRTRAYLNAEPALVSARVCGMFPSRMFRLDLGSIPRTVAALLPQYDGPATHLLWVVCAPDGHPGDPEFCPKNFGKVAVLKLICERLASSGASLPLGSGCLFDEAMPFSATLGVQLVGMAKQRACTGADGACRKAGLLAILCAIVAANRGCMFDIDEFEDSDSDSDSDNDEDDVDDEERGAAFSRSAFVSMSRALLEIVTADAEPGLLVGQIAARYAFDPWRLYAAFEWPLLRDTAATQMCQKRRMSCGKAHRAPSRIALLITNLLNQIFPIDRVLLNRLSCRSLSRIDSSIRDEVATIELAKRLLRKYEYSSTQELIDFACPWLIFLQYSYPSAWQLSLLLTSEVENMAHGAVSVSLNTRHADFAAYGLARYLSSRLSIDVWREANRVLPGAGTSLVETFVAQLFAVLQQHTERPSDAENPYCIAGTWIVEDNGLTQLWNVERAERVAFCIQTLDRALRNFCEDGAGCGSLADSLFKLTLRLAQYVARLPDTARKCCSRAAALCSRVAGGLAFGTLRGGWVNINGVYMQNSWPCLTFGVGTNRESVAAAFRVACYCSQVGYDEKLELVASVIEGYWQSVRCLGAFGGPFPFLPKPELIQVINQCMFWRYVAFVCTQDFAALRHGEVVVLATPTNVARLFVGKGRAYAIASAAASCAETPLLDGERLKDRGALAAIFSFSHLTLNLLSCSLVIERIGVRAFLYRARPALRSSLQALLLLCLDHRSRTPGFVLPYEVALRIMLLLVADEMSGWNPASYVHSLFLLDPDGVAHKQLNAQAVELPRSMFSDCLYSTKHPFESSWFTTTIGQFPPRALRFPPGYPLDRGSSSPSTPAS